VKKLHFLTQNQRHFSAKKTLATVISFVIFFEVFGLPLAEAKQYDHMWSSRRSASTKVASLPKNINPSNSSVPGLVEPLPRISALVEKNNTAAFRGIKAELPAQWKSLLQNIPYTHVTLQSFHGSFSNNQAPLILVQDIHLNTEAQVHIASLMDSLIENKKIDLIGVEGAFQEFDFRRLRAFPSRDIIKNVSDKFLTEKLIGAPSYAGLVTKQLSARIVGVDDRPAYDANVQAYLLSTAGKKQVNKTIAKLEKEVQDLKSKQFSAELKLLDDSRISYHQGKLGLGSYLKKLAALEPEPEFVVEKFLAAFQMEASLDFQKVEAERKILLEKLVKNLSDEDTDLLLSRSTAYRLGRISYADYYGGLKDLVKKYQIDLRATPIFDDYIRYVFLADGIRSDELFSSLSRLEEKVFLKLAQSPEDKALLQKKSIRYSSFEINEI
jgi:hypothetical protein